MSQRKIGNGLAAQGMPISHERTKPLRAPMTAHLCGSRARSTQLTAGKGGRVTRVTRVTRKAGAYGLPVVELVTQGTYPAVQ
jgi:hypothetical protein